MRLKDLIKEYDGNAVVYADDGNGAGFGPNGAAILLTEEMIETWGELDLAPLPEKEIRDGVEVNYATDWVCDGRANGYRYKIYF